jgi:hypothetical protein
MGPNFNGTASQKLLWWEATNEKTQPRDPQPRKALDERGFNLAYVSQLHQQAHDSGRDSSISAFWPAHDLCYHCRGRGNQAGEHCQPCGGTGPLTPANATQYLYEVVARRALRNR